MMRWSAGAGILFLVAACRPAAGPIDETTRIRTHLERVEGRMAREEPQGLTLEQRTARRETLSWLAEYRRAGRFPRNYVRAGERVPVFVDPHGTPCAVGYLLLRSGEHALVEEIVRTDNLVRVPELAAEPALAAWLSERGITLEEAAAIQPTYGEPPTTAEAEPIATYSEVTIGASLLSTAVTSYVLATRAEPDGWDATRIPGAASLGFHTAMIGHGLTSDAEEPNWALGLNFVGVLVSGIGLVDQALGGDAVRGPSGMTIRPWVSSEHVGVSLIH